jgi:hypothetical protein
VVALDDFIGRILDWASAYLSRRPGLLPLVGMALIGLNFLLQLVPGQGSWVVDSNLFLHVGLILGFLGFLLIRALG